MAARVLPTWAAAGQKVAGGKATAGESEQPAGVVI